MATLASTARGAYRVVGPLALLLPFAFLGILFVPLLRTSISIFTVQEIALAGVVRDLFHEDLFLFVVVCGFGMVVPLVKMAYAAAVWYGVALRRVPRHVRLLGALGKLSMLDVMLLALFIVAFKGTGIGTVEIRYGLYVYALLLIASLAIGLAMAAALHRQQVADTALLRF